MILECFRRFERIKCFIHQPCQIKLFWPTNKKILGETLESTCRKFHVNAGKCVYFLLSSNWCNPDNPIRSTSIFMLCQINFSEIFWIVLFLPQCEAIAFAFESLRNPIGKPWIILCCIFLEKINKLVLFYIKWSLCIQKSLRVFRKFTFFSFIPSNFC